MPTRTRDPKPEVFLDPKPEPEIFRVPDPKPEVFLDPKPEIFRVPDPKPEPEIFRVPDPKPEPEIFRVPDPKPEPEIFLNPRHRQKNMHRFYADNLFIEFPAHDSAAASDGQAVAKWLFTPLQNNVPKVLGCSLDMDYENWSSKIEAFKAAFASASSPANFIISIAFPLPD
ncbi:hypothetical protein niasHT_005503 [Heterodera trifolii]|uniref:Uncharacterized protein n=1 Tax=Heterodera trifolii TaxID=157864 RepID=A0ABD2LUM4_9BILA